jgi:hypothetical protein
VSEARCGFHFERLTAVANDGVVYVHALGEVANAGNRDRLDLVDGRVASCGSRRVRSFQKGVKKVHAPTWAPFVNVLPQNPALPISVACAIALHEPAAYTVAVRPIPVHDPAE